MTDHPPLLTRGEDGTIRFTRGKHAGKPLTSVSQGYLRFLMEHAHPTQDDGRLLLAEWATREFGRPMTWEEIMGKIKADFENLMAQHESRFGTGRADN